MPSLLLAINNGKMEKNSPRCKQDISKNSILLNYSMHRETPAKVQTLLYVLQVLHGHNTATETKKDKNKS